MELTEEQERRVAEIEARLSYFSLPGAEDGHLIRYYDRDGRPMSMARWAALREVVPCTAVVKHDHLVSQDGERQVLVSTAWVGMDYGLFGEGPLIFETMVFGDTLLGDEQRRYSTEQSAFDGHEEWLRRVTDLDHDLDRDLSPECQCCGSESR